MDKSQYLRIKKGLTTAILDVQKQLGPDAAERLMSGIVDTFESLDSFFDVEAAVGHTLENCLNGQSKRLSAKATKELCAAFEMFSKIPNQ
ncbi:hypothetical protein L0244_37230 [bacterium]|nr:hypothetical protein [bacterium]